MRLYRLCIAFGLCLAVTGCVGGGRSSAQSTNPASDVNLAKIAPTATSLDGSSDPRLLKSTAILAVPTPTAAPRRASVASQGGPLSCVEQRMRDLRDGKVLPSGSTCS